jgi:chromosome segregation ATPase
MTDKEQLYSQINPFAVKLELDQYPDKIKAQKAQVRDLKQAFNDIDADRANRELELLADITDETDPGTSKAKYSNEKARQAELVKRCRADQDYIAAAKRSREAETALNQAQDELDMLENKYRSCRYRAEVVAAELRFWAGEEAKESVHKHQPY